MATRSAFEGNVSRNDHDRKTPSIHAFYCFHCRDKRQTKSKVVLIFLDIWTVGSTIESGCLLGQDPRLFVLVCGGFCNNPSMDLKIRPCKIRTCHPSGNTVMLFSGAIDLSFSSLSTLVVDYSRRDNTSIILLLVLE